MSWGQSQQRPQLARRTLGRCRNKEDFDNGEVIDVDKIRGDVVVVDDSETSYCRTTRANEIPTVVIDDEERDGDGAPGNVDSSPRVEASDSDDDCHIFVAEAGLAASEMRRRVTSPECGSSRNRYGLCSTADDSSTESDASELEIPESGSSYSDNSDCEILDGSSGIIREQWERAALKRKLARMGRYAAEDWVSASGSSSDPDVPSNEPAHDNDEGQNYFTEAHSQHFEDVPVSHGQSESCSRKETLSPGMAPVDCVVGDRFESPKENFNVEDSVPGTGDQFESPKVNVNVEDSVPGTGDWFESPKAKVTVEDSVPGTSMHPDGPAFQHKNEAFSSNGVNLPDESAFDYRGDDTADLEIRPRVSVWDEGLETEIHVGNDWFSFMNVGGQDPVGEQDPARPTFATSKIHDGVSPLENSVPCSGKTSPCDSQPCCVNQVYSDVAGFEDNEEQVNLDPAGNTNIQHGSNVSPEGAFHGKEDSAAQAKEHSTAKKISPVSNLECEPQAEHEMASCISTKESDCENDLIGDREKHKESDEFRRAAEEEWASRQRELQIQAEEAQRLRKRRKAETLRLLDMERRQKQRLEEIRESQKKVEETVNLKEVYRIEVRKQLEKMELIYKDMASLLRGLGIHVGGGRFPLSSDVNSAYKQALLRFHPDRSSKTDIRKQVEAEETFKLITRSKEKLVLV